MTLIELREKLRAELRRRIAAVLINQTKLSFESGVRQATISRFLQKEFSELSFASMTHLMRAQHIQVEDLFDAPPAFKKATKNQSIPLVAQVTAAVTAVIVESQVLRWTDITVQSLGSLPLNVIGERASWTRFVAIEATEDQIAFMHPFLRRNTTLVIDRHHQEPLLQYQRRRAMYLVSGESPLRIGYLQIKGNEVSILRTGIGTDKIRGSDIVGRVCELIVRTRT